MPLWGFLLSFVAAALWAASPIMVNHGLSASRCSTSDINPVRSAVFFISAFATAYIATGGHIPVMTSAAAWFYIFVSVFISYTLGDILYFIAIREIGVSLAVPVANGYPILVAFTSWFILGEEPTQKLLWGIVIVVAGLMLLRFGGKDEKTEDIRRALHNKRRLMKGFSLAIAAGLMWALSSPLTKLAILTSGASAVNITFYRSVAFLIITIAVRAAQRRYMPNQRPMPLREIPLRAALYFAGASVIGLCAGSIIYAQCLAVMPVAIVTAITATSPFIAALYERIFKRVMLTRLQWTGIAMTIVGSVIVGL
ncbi:MAG: DMT family transporter [Cloacibacillus sp.]